MTAAIKFGTSGWRAIVADEFTVANIRRAVAGIAAYVKTQPAPHRVLVGRDPRFLGESFVAEAASVLAAAGVTPIVIPEAAPTPAIAYAVRTLKTSGAINFTASHNPPEYNGIKFSTPDGAPALPEVTKQIEAAIVEQRCRDGRDPRGRTARRRIRNRRRQARLPQAPRRTGRPQGHRQIWHQDRLRSLLGRGPRLLLATCCARPASPSKPCTTTATCSSAATPLSPTTTCSATRKAKMKEIGASLGIATDGDADRFGIVDADGTFIQPNYIIALLFDYLVETRGWRNGVAKSVATTNLINALAEHHKVQLYETPVGFKYIGELIIEDKIAIGGEESAGLTIRGHVPEKDGIIAGLLVAEMVAVRGNSLGAQLKELFAKVGSYYPVRENFHLTPERKAAFTEKLKTDPSELERAQGSAGCAHRRPQADPRRRLVGLLPAFGHRAGGPRLHRSAQREGHGSAPPSGRKICAWGLIGRACRTGNHKRARARPPRRPCLYAIASPSWALHSWRPAGTAVAVGLAMTMMFHVIYGQHGLSAWQQKRSEDRDLQQQIQDLKQENSQMQHQIDELKSDPDAIEREAREKLHYAKPGEVIYTLPDAPQPGK